MYNPYASTLAASSDPNWIKKLASDFGIVVLLFLIWLAVTYAVSLPGSYLLTRDTALIVTSPFLPVGLLAAAVAGQTILAGLMTLFACPLAVTVVARALGVRKARAWVAVISMGICYGLFLRLFYAFVNIA